MPGVSTPEFLSTKDIDPRERLIFALDVPTADDARALVEALGDEVRFFKIGLELFTADGYFALLDWLTGRGCKAFADLKLYDVPATVGRAVRNLARGGATFTTVHGDGAIVRAAAEHKGGLGILAVTVLTSMDQADLEAMGVSVPLEELVVMRARGALAAGCDGVIASGLEAPRLRAALGMDFTVVCPGIRPVAADDDQKRVVGVERAFRGGADHIVVGRPIRDAADPKAAAAEIQEQIAGVFGR